MLRISFILILLLLTFTACKKELSDSEVSILEIPPCDTTFVDIFSDDTLQASPYFAAYPGSWWTHSDGATRTCDYWGQVIYETNKVAEGNCITVYRDRKIVPHTSQWGFLFNQSAYKLHIAYHVAQFTRLIDTIPGLIYHTWADPPNGNFYETLDIKVIEHLGLMEVNGAMYNDVIHVRHAFNYQHKHYLSSYTVNLDYYYARNIGQIRRIYSYDNSPLVDTVDLVDYYIAPH